METLKQKVFVNPILSGFYPDPSICRVGNDYYLVTSSFSYFPGVPIFHSKDLVNWRQLGHVLDRPSQLDLSDVEQSEGIFAPTIRYNNGIFYVITTWVGGGKNNNFVVTAEDPAGPWSEPIWLEDAPGIDPSLFFDEDGKAYYTGTRPLSSGPRYDGDWEIWLQEFDLKAKRLTGDKYVLWKGALVGVIWPEGPHLYKVDGFYYLMIAEGGTGHEHAVTIARSKKITGPYLGNPANPILTHRHLGQNYPIVNVGHGDLVHTQNDEWWMVVLASRPYGGYYRNLGRETFLVPVVWENGWPVVSPGDGKVLFSYPFPDLPECRWPGPESCENFESSSPGLQWNFLRTPTRFWSLQERPGYLRLYLKPEKITEKSNPAFIGRRQQHLDFSIRTVMEFLPENSGEEAGLVLIQNNRFHYRFVKILVGGEQLIRLIECNDGKEQVIASKKCEWAKVYLKVEARGQDYNFFFGENPAQLRLLAGNIDGRILSTDLAGGFVGTYIGMYVSSNGQKSNNYADFDWFEYNGYNNQIVEGRKV